MTRSIGIELPGLARMAQVTRAISDAAKGGPLPAPEPMRILTSWMVPAPSGQLDLAVPNRAVMAPMPTGTAELSGLPSADTFAWYQARARGGIGIVVVEPTYVAPSVEPCARRSLVAADASALEPFSALARTIRTAGSLPAISLDHPDNRPFEDWSHAELRGVVARFGDVAHTLRAAGFTALHLSLDASSCLGRSLTRNKNRRTDGYGRGPHGRRRLAREVVDVVARIGLPLIVRLPCPVAPLSSDVHRGAASLAVAMVEAGATVIEIVPGPQFDDPSLPLVAGSGEAVLATQGAKIATLLADSGCAVPIILGGRIVSPLGAEAALAVAGIDAVSIGRALIADPAWLAKIRAGIDSEIVPCIGCLACLEHSETRLNLEGPADRLASFALDGRIGCVTNGDAGHEATSTTDATSPRRITVLGTGLPGLEFARVAASRGHEVTIVPDSYPLGGITGLRAGVPGNAELGRAPLSAFERLRRIGVTVSATTPPDADFTVDARPPPVLPVDWGSGRNVLRAAEVLGRDLHQMYGIGRRVAVCGPGALTAEVALFLAGWGRRPTVIVPGSLADPFPDVHPMYAARLRERLFGYKCELVTGATAQEWRDARDRKSHLVVRRDDGEATLGPFQTAVDCRGWDAPRVTGSHGAVVGDATLASELRVLVRAATNLARLL